MSREPLTPQERELADVLSRLPALEPSAALDANVLAQARRALHPAASAPARRRRPWWMSAGLGTAAAAVMAAGVAWQAGLFDMSFGSSVPVPRLHSRSEGSSAETSVAISMDHLPAPAAPPAAPPLAEIAPPPPAPRAAATHRQAVEPASSEPAEPAMQATAPRPSPERSDAARKTAAPAIAEASRHAPAPAPADTTLDSVAVTGTRTTHGGSALLPPWQEDAQLAPDAWLERIRERVRRGERNDAVLSLRRFTLKHPAHRVPDELIPLLAGRP